ncbi:tRNA pseudouridine(55) synthase TruB [Longibacter salinarum]|uniref:tRNA pseudouridine synthase B n=1 Tax=Longibacter salinarum TaxID=1850348 RepID=A0A2A8D3D8_9BACT|nr:tRNA pseudouridine(55) synthase TruB [Longibacter salinarum]
MDPDLVFVPPNLPEDIAAGAVLPIDKPANSTSFDIVREVRSLADLKKVGHAGTLDPLATGLLIVLVARPATRLQDAFMYLRKTYTGTMRLGETTPSHDSETAVTESVDTSHLSEAEIRDALEAFVGEIEQVPPMYSAVKIGGEKLYKKARRGEQVERPPRPVTIYDACITDIRGSEVDFKIDCSKGTYVRSLARDVGAELGVGAHLTALRRTAIGDYRVEDAWSLDQLRDAFGM